MYNLAPLRSTELVARSQHRHSALSGVFDVQLDASLSRVHFHHRRLSFTPTHRLRPIMLSRMCLNITTLSAVRCLVLNAPWSPPPPNFDFRNPDRGIPILPFISAGRVSATLGKRRVLSPIFPLSLLFPPYPDTQKPAA